MLGKGAFYYINHHNSGTFLDFQIQQLAISKPVEVGRFIYLKRKPYNVLFKRSFETGRNFVMKGSRQVLVRVVLFQLRERGHPQDDATPNFFADSKRPI